MREKIELLVNKRGKDASFQALRGIAIFAIVLIHTTSTAKNFNSSSPNFYSGIITRQFVNFGVPLFLFISGYFSAANKEVTNKKYLKFYKKRISRLLLPYLIWSTVGIVILKESCDYDIKNLMLYLLTGQSVGIYYYFIVLYQLVLLTPLLILMASYRKTRIYPILINILFLVMLYYVWIKHPEKVVFPYYALPFANWIGFYYWGILSRTIIKSDWFKRNFSWSFLWFIIFLALSVLEAEYIFKLSSNAAFAGSQNKISCFFASFFFINCLMGLRLSNLQSTYLSLVGEYSFGIFLSHMFILPDVSKIIKIMKPIWAVQPLAFLISTAITITICSLLIFSSRKFFGENFSRKILGF